MVRKRERAGEVVFDFDGAPVVLPNISAHGYRLKQPIGFLAQHRPEPTPKKKRAPRPKPKRPVAPTKRGQRTR